MIPGWQMEGYHRLRTAVVKDAVNDYHKALKKSDRIGEVCREQTALEHWFLSPWGQILSGDNGELIIEKCRENYKNIPNSKARDFIPQDVQLQIYADYKSGIGYKPILQKYKIASKTLYGIVRRWEK
jgi:hypothetical protein